MEFPPDPPPYLTTPGIEIVLNILRAGIAENATHAFALKRAQVSAISDETLRVLPDTVGEEATRFVWRAPRR